MENIPIRTEAEYRQALAEIEGLMNAERDTPEGERLDALVTLVEAYEEKYYSLTEHLVEGANQARSGQFVDQSLEELLEEFRSRELPRNNR